MKIEFKTGNAAFEGEGNYEVIRILRNIADQVERGCVLGIIVDINGNKVGEWDLEEAM
jgi:hypothetical protein